MTKRLPPDGVAIVTGAGRGIGQAVDLAFAAATARRAGPPSGRWVWT